MLNKLSDLEKRCVAYLFNDQRMIMTDADKENFFLARECSICKHPFKLYKGEMMDKVRDHNHITGNYRGAAHTRCNLQARKQYKIPVFFHNFRGYDSHLITLALTRFPDKEIQIIGQGMEKYLMLCWGDHLVFKDSLQFMAASLESLTANLFKSGVEKFAILRGEFHGVTDEIFNLLLRKGVFPYDFLDSMEKLALKSLPRIEDFSNRLRDSKCSVEDYEHAQKVWTSFNCLTLKVYYFLFCIFFYMNFIHFSLQINLGLHGTLPEM